MANEPLVIVGAGLAGTTAAKSLREADYDGGLVLIGDEGEFPYDHPPLSKGYLQGKTPREKVFLQRNEWYPDHDVDLRLGVSVSAIDPAAHVVTLDIGEPIHYAKLLLATGASPRRLTVPGAELSGVHYLRRLSDADRLRDALGTVKRLVIIGGGWIGLEVAAAARGYGVEVVLLESGELPLLRVLGAEMAQVFADVHTAKGVDLRCGVQVEALVGDTHVSAVRLADGTVIDADAVVVGVGIVPNTKLADAAGLQIDNGIVVDSSLRSSDPDILAVGDVANAYHPLLGKNIRVEHWANALNQPATAAQTMLGRDTVYDRVPYFFSDQYDLGLEYLGYVEPGGYDSVVTRGDVEKREFIAFWLVNGTVAAGMNVNIWDVTDDIRDLITSQRTVDSQRLADRDVPLSDV